MATFVVCAAAYAALFVGGVGYLNVLAIRAARRGR